MLRGSENFVVDNVFTEEHSDFARSDLGERQLLGIPGTVINTVNQVLEAAINPIGQISSILSAVGADATNAAGLFQDTLDAIDAALPTATLTSIEDASIISQGVTNVVEAIFDGTATNFFENAVRLAENSLGPRELGEVLETYSTGINSENNINTVEPAQPVFPRKSADDAPYSRAESSFRGAIYITNTFTYGQKPPVILVPGTGSKGGVAFTTSYIELLEGVD
ncbi:hypothetical protein W97_00634 [Coniosporium apollinis CBS 100218]|uniref:Uncharacterized protein n=1 Tax=Coniosporium apollinis (strain CBS 100218) TaxID=1168221 RepID=R7YHY0_CONA1|nr:uncharacterized protein W97_00634 [Coniosporium apollinis CBS 100218]EON61419.1 hypothetical protein W97_00634 [Coniosporium apollinis CBS 100218]